MLIIIGSRMWLFSMLYQRFDKSVYVCVQTDTIGSYKSAESFLSAKEEIDEPTIVLRSSALDVYVTIYLFS